MFFLFVGLSLAYLFLVTGLWLDLDPLDPKATGDQRTILKGIWIPESFFFHSTAESLELCGHAKPATQSSQLEAWNLNWQQNNLWVVH